MSKVKLERVIVVGASSGIGAAVARRLASEGARVALVARRAAELEQVAAAITQTGRGQAQIYPHDVERVDEVPALLERIRGDLGGIDTVVYAAGVMPAIAESEYDFEKDRAMVVVNLLGAMAWLNPTAAVFEAQRSGTIIGISSIAGERGRRGNPAYCTTKAAMTTYLESLRNRLARYGVNVVTIKPGFVDTAMTRGMNRLPWLISADTAAHRIVAMARRGSGASGFVPRRWWLVATIIRTLPSFIFRRLNI
ncbi:MAG TPA: SDR family NAD(P)-dependent oxidoreductase [Kofleriaceae bacterium]